MYLLDSSVCIDFMRGRMPSVLNLMQKSDPSLFALCSIIESELRLGAEKSNNPTRRRLETEQFIRAFHILPYDSNCAKQYAVIRAELEQTGKTVGPMDLLIAATAVANNCVLVTGNDREFSRVPGLRVEVWAEVDWN